MTRVGTRSAPGLRRTWLTQRFAATFQRMVVLNLGSEPLRATEQWVRPVRLKH